MVASAADVVSFWREAGPDRWFNKDAAFDDEIRERFFDTYEAAAAGKLSDWEQSAQGALALLILLDQFPRNMFRGDARAFATDPLARAIAGRRHCPRLRQPGAQGIARASSIFRSSIRRILPTRSAASLSIKRVGDADNLKWAEMHADIIRRFGRFPHRNAVLGRTTTPEEQAFLDGGGFAG